MKLLTIFVLCAFAVGCGYGSHSVTPPAPGTTPVINQLSPSSVKANSGDFNLMVTGSQFASGAFVTFNSAKMATTWNSSGQVTAAIPNSAIMNSGTINVTVTNPATGGGLYGGGTAAATSTAVPFTIN
jgi:trimeric autotransporter adhesin